MELDSLMHWIVELDVVDVDEMKVNWKKEENNQHL